MPILLEFRRKIGERFRMTYSQRRRIHQITERRKNLDPIATAGGLSSATTQELMLDIDFLLSMVEGLDIVAYGMGNAQWVQREMTPQEIATMDNK